MNSSVHFIHFSLRPAGNDREKQQEMASVKFTAAVVIAQGYRRHWKNLCVYKQYNESNSNM